MASVTPPQLHKTLVKYFSLEELETLCLNLGIMYENLGGSGLSAKALSLVTYSERHGRFSEVVSYVQKARPHVDLATAESSQDGAGGDTAQGNTQTEAKSGSTYNFYGPVTGSAIGESSVQAENIAGGDITIHNYAEPTNKAEFAEQLAQLEALLQQAIANGEIEDDTAVEDVKDAIKEAQKPEPRAGRLKRRLEDVKEVVEGAGGVVDAARKAGTAVAKALTILPGLIKVVTTIF